MHKNFLHLVHQQLAKFRPFHNENIQITGSLFLEEKQAVIFFVKEIEQTALALSQQHDEDYANVYAKKLFQQFEALNKAISSLNTASPKKTLPFHSHYRFPKNVHSLPPARRLTEYRKALRALNEKISWLIEQQYNANFSEKAPLANQIAETEYRKMNCLKAIEELEEQILIAGVKR